MKKAFPFLLLFLLTALSAFGNNIVVENPPFSVRNNKTLEIDKVEVSDAETMFYITAYNKPKNWIRIDKETYIRVNGEKYLIKSAKGIELDKEVYSDETGRISFVLNFPPIDKNTQTIDFIESDCEGCFKIWGIELHEGELKNKKEVPQKIKNALLIVDDAGSLPDLKFERGEATLSGQVLGYIPEMNTFVDVYVDNPILGEQERYYAKLSADGSFSVKVPLICTSEVFVNIEKLFRKNLLLTPKQESILFLDLQEKCRTEPRNNKNKKDTKPFLYNAGCNSYINNWLANNSLSEMNGSIKHKDFMSDISDIKSALEYKTYLLNKKDTLLSEISKLDVSGSLKEYLSLKAVSDGAYYLFMGFYYLPEAYGKKHKYDDGLEVERIQGTFNKEYYSFIKELPLNNPKMLYTSEYSSIVQYLRTRKIITDSLYLNRSILQIKPSAIDSLISMVDMPAEDLKYANSIKQDAYDNWSVDRKDTFKVVHEEYVDALLSTNGLNKKDLRLANALKRLLSSSDLDIENICNIKSNLSYRIRDSKHYSDSIKKIKIRYPAVPKIDPDQEKFAEDWQNKYRDQLSFIRKKEDIEERIRLLSEILGFDYSLFFDFIISQSYAGNFETQTPLTALELNYIKERVSPLIYNYIKDKNTKTETALLQAKNNRGYSVYNAPEVEDDALFYEIIKPFEGKVVFIDFWATWCGPCRSAMKIFEGAKKGFKDKDVVFLYLADETSPDKTWNNMITSIDGEHYRLTSSQFEYLKRKFNFSGVPSYMIIDKKGNQVYKRTGFEGEYKVSRLINDELNK